VAEHGRGQAVLGLAGDLDRVDVGGDANEQVTGPNVSS